MPAHLILIHFPVALLVTGAAADLAGAATGRAGLRRGAGWLLLLGALAALLAFFTGQGALQAALGRVSPADTRLEAHTQWGAVGTWALVGAGFLRAVWRDRLSGVHGWVTLAAGVLSALLAVAITLSGHAISHGG